MGFWNGRVTFTRYQVSGEKPVPFGDQVIDLARAHLIGQHSAPDPADGVSVGWGGGEHMLDVELDGGKNIVDDALHLAIRIDTNKIPGTLLRAYTQIEIDARAQNNPSGIATKIQRQEAKEAAKLRADAEAADGRFRRLNHFPVLWDGRNNILYAGSTSTSVLDRLLSLFRETFDRSLEPITAGILAKNLELNGPEGPGRRPSNLRERRLGIVGGAEDSGISVAWSEDDPDSLDHLGNEFMVWLWHTLQNDGDSVKLTDDSHVTVMLAKTLTLDCPRGEMGAIISPTTSQSACLKRFGHCKQASYRARREWCLCVTVWITNSRCKPKPWPSREPRCPNPRIGGSRSMMRESHALKASATWLKQSTCSFKRT